jgi:hypothetical protein
MTLLSALSLTLLLAAPGPLAPTPPTAGRGELLARLAFLRGVWAGPATGTGREGPYAVTQVERVGPMLGGDVLVIEGRGFRADDSTAFNAFAVVSWDPRAKRYEFRSYAMGQAGTFEFTLTGDGYVWEVPAGPGAVVRYTATVKDGRWREVGERLEAGKPPVKVFEMNLRRVGDTDWPLGTPVGPEVGR